MQLARPTEDNDARRGELNPGKQAGVKLDSKSRCLGHQKGEIAAGEGTSPLVFAGATGDQLHATHGRGFSLFRMDRKRPTISGRSLKRIALANLANAPRPMTT